MRSCAVCFHWEPEGRPFEAEEGSCTKRSPQVFLVNADDGAATFQTVWPTTGRQDRCGEFSHKNGPKEPT